MDAKFLNPFLDSIQNVLATMAQIKAKPKKSYIKKDQRSIGDVTGIIGMVSEQAQASLAISFSETTIVEIATRMLGEEIKAVNETTADLVGEITNMVTGGAKRQLAENGLKFDLAIPSTVVGKGHVIAHKTSGPVICVPFETPVGSFFIELCFYRKM